MGLYQYSTRYNLGWTERIMEWRDEKPKGTERKSQTKPHLTLKKKVTSRSGRNQYNILYDGGGFDQMKTTIYNGNKVEWLCFILTRNSAHLETPETIWHPIYGVPGIEMVTSRLLAKRHTHWSIDLLSPDKWKLPLVWN